VSDDKKAQIKEALHQLHLGASPEQVKEKFRHVLESTNPVEIAKIEDELVKEGMDRTQLRSLCDVHMAIFKEQLEKQQSPVEPNQPISILMEEHKFILKMADELNTVIEKIQRTSDIAYATQEVDQVEHIAEEFKDAEKHFLREENVLFPMIEKHGITEPPAVMWMEHNDIKAQEKKLHALVADLEKIGFLNYKEQLSEIAQTLSSLLQSHFYKENNILFPAALKVITETEWIDVRKEFDEIGYCCFTPPELIAAKPKVQEPPKILTAEGTLQFATGSLTPEQLEALLNALPAEITFVDADDTVRYFNHPKQRMFVRTKAVIGRKVQMCHPQKSLHIVTKIVESFKAGKKDVAEFWITMNNRFLYIRFFPVRNPEGKYLGTVEVVQDITESKKLEGEKRLLDWKE